MPASQRAYDPGDGVLPEHQDQKESAHSERVRELVQRPQIQSRIGGLRLSTCTTADIQRLLYRIDEQEELSHQSFLNINSLLSAIFTHARCSGTLQGPNPTDGVEIPEGKRTEKMHKYTLEEVEKITEAVDGVARCAVVVAAWTGLSLAELRGLKWADKWHGFHAFRRCFRLGTRLHNNGTPIETVAKVLRHGSGSEVTLKYYVEVEEETKAAALQSLPRKIKKAQRNQILLTSASHSGRKTV
jgi:integrase